MKLPLLRGEQRLGSAACSGELLLATRSRCSHRLGQVALPLGQQEEGGVLGPGGRTRPLGACGGTGGRCRREQLGLGGLHLQGLTDALTLLAR